MSEAPDNRELGKRFALLKKDFEVMQANVNSTLNEMRAESARRETRLLLAMAGMITLAVAVLGLGLAIHGYLTGQPQAPAPQSPVTINMPPQAPAVPAPASEAAPAAP